MSFLFGFIAGVVCTLAGLFVDIVTDKADDGAPWWNRKRRRHLTPKI